VSFTFAGKIDGIPNSVVSEFARRDLARRLASNAESRAGLASARVNLFAGCEVGWDYRRG